jgi:hypothetical protein
MSGGVRRSNSPLGSADPNRENPGPQEGQNR